MADKRGRGIADWCFDRVIFGAWLGPTSFNSTRSPSFRFSARSRFLGSAIFPSESTWASTLIKLLVSIISPLVFDWESSRPFAHVTVERNRTVPARPAAVGTDLRGFLKMHDTRTPADCTGVPRPCWRDAGPSTDGTRFDRLFHPQRCLSTADVAGRETGHDPEGVSAPSPSEGAPYHDPRLLFSQTRHLEDLFLPQ